jgi:hypothetical protein
MKTDRQHSDSEAQNCEVARLRAHPLPSLNTSSVDRFCEGIKAVLVSLIADRTHVSCRCALWVISGHFAKSRPCPLYRTSVSNLGRRRATKANRSPTRRNPGKSLTNAGVIGDHLQRFEKALQFAGVIANRLHVIWGDLQQPAQFFVE